MTVSRSNYANMCSRTPLSGGRVSPVSVLCWLQALFRGMYKNLYFAGLQIVGLGDAGTHNFWSFKV